MYQILKTSNGYSFRTINETVYEVYFTSFGHFVTEAFEDRHDSLVSKNDLYYFGIERMNQKKGSKADIFTKRTIAYILFIFFNQYRDAIIVFNYTSDGNRINGKRRLFKKWFDEYSSFSLFQLYQHDYNDDLTVCCLYLRRGGFKFDKFKNDIENFIKNIDHNFDENKIDS